MRPPEARDSLMSLGTEISEASSLGILPVDDMGESGESGIPIANDTVIQWNPFNMKSMSHVIQFVLSEVCVIRCLNMQNQCKGHEYHFVLSGFLC